MRNPGHPPAGVFAFLVLLHRSTVFMELKPATAVNLNSQKLSRAMNALIRDTLRSYYNYKSFGPLMYQRLAEASAHAGEFLDACEKMSPHRLRFSVMTDILAKQISEGRGNLADIFHAQRMGKTRLDRQDMPLKDYIKLVTHPDIINAFCHDHDALDFFLGLSSLEIENGSEEIASRSPLSVVESDHNQIIERLLKSARSEARNDDIKSLLKEKITPFFLNTVSIRQAARAVHEKLCHENCCDGHRERLGSLAYN